jgi:cellulose synthase/poly-beta-1,6-N-acetylglucosamine synthase-like glycosyltransferase
MLDLARVPVANRSFLTIAVPTLPGERQTPLRAGYAKRPCHEVLGQMTLIENAFVTIIIPCRNEVRHISTCLESLIETTFPKQRLQILVVDGMSDDGTREQIEGFSARYPFVQLLVIKERYLTI